MADAGDVPRLLAAAARTTPRDYSQPGGTPQPGDGFTPQGRAAGISPTQLRAGVAVFDPSGSTRQPNIPQAIPAPAPETIALAITDVPAVRMPPNPTYGARFKPAESALITVPNPGLQPGERPGDPPIPSGV